MSRYFFNIVSGNSAPIPNNVGEDFDLVEAAREHARAMACGLQRERADTFPAGASVEVPDDSGKVIFRVPRRHRGILDDEQAPIASVR